MAKKIVLGVSAGVLALALIGFAAFQLFVAQGVSPSYQINQPSSAHPNVLIATQKKAFKDSVMQEIQAHYQDGPVYIKVVDVSQLEEVQREEWDKIVLFTTVEMGKIPQAVTQFLQRQQDPTGIFLPVTAASGVWNGNTFSVDAIAQASKAENQQTMAQAIIAFIDQA